MCKLGQGYEFDYCLNGWQFSRLSLPDPSKLFSIIEKKCLALWQVNIFQLLLIQNRGYSIFIAVYECQASQVALLVKNPPAINKHGFDPWVGKIPWRRAWQSAPVFLPR